MNQIEDDMHGSELCTHRQRGIAHGPVHDKSDQERQDHVEPKRTASCIVCSRYSLVYLVSARRSHLEFARATSADCYSGGMELDRERSTQAAIIQFACTHTRVRLPRVDDAVVVAVEEGDVLLQHAHVVVPVLVGRGAVGVVDVRRHQGSRQICAPRLSGRRVSK